MILKLLIFIFLFLSFCWLTCPKALSQSTSKQLSVTFPVDALEYTVEFPSKPKIEEEGSLAVLIIKNVFIRAEVFPLSDDEKNALQQQDSTKLYEIASGYAKWNGLSDVTITTGITSLGTYVKLKGFKQVKTSSAVYETIIYFGKVQKIILSAGGFSGQFPTPDVIKFYNSLKLKNRRNQLNLLELKNPVLNLAI